MRRHLKWIVLGLLFLLFLAAAGYGAVYVNDFPKTHPEETLRIEERVVQFFAQITLPIKLAKLSRLEPDKHILMPVYGRKISDVEDTWGAPRGENGERKHEGQDIFAPRGTPVFSGTNGFVTRITEDSLGGNSVYVTGAGGVRYYYTHLDRFPRGLSRGVPVTTDTVIGFVGNSGNASTTPAHLHFGIYIRGEAFDPLPLLADR